MAAVALDISPQALSILVSVLVVLLTAGKTKNKSLPVSNLTSFDVYLVLIYFWRQRRGARSGILMVGLNDSGKTLMFSRIVHDQYVKTFTSVNENVGEVTCTKVT
jgi:hypothetical protein